MADMNSPPENFVRPKAFYDQWQEQEGIPIYKLFHVENLMQVELGHWERFGCNGAFVNLADPHITTAAILEVPPGGKSKAVKHIFEALLYGVSGRGKTVLSAPESPEVTVEWSTNSLFSPPLNTVYSHHNLDASSPLRILMVSNAPLVLSLYHNERFVFENSAVFDDRFRGQP
ncbi:MAG: hypothetical protein OEN50_07640, partial [Deltaproteobacteria bacterium]|nr:hypothetical protein [Deltaproteobacteria bacterium]